MEPMVGLEPTTCRLRIGCSTTELHRRTFSAIARDAGHGQSLFAGGQGRD
jgi:hypothetical protein